MMWSRKSPKTGCASHQACGISTKKGSLKMDSINNWVAIVILNVVTPAYDKITFYLIDQRAIWRRVWCSIWNSEFWVVVMVIYWLPLLSTVLSHMAIVLSCLHRVIITSKSLLYEHYYNSQKSSYVAIKSISYRIGLSMLHQCSSNLIVGMDNAWLSGVMRDNGDNLVDSVLQLIISRNMKWLWLNSLQLLSGCEYHW